MKKLIYKTKEAYLAQKGKCENESDQKRKSEKEIEQKRKSE